MAVQSNYVICMQGVATKHFEILNRFKRHSERALRVYIRRKTLMFSSNVLRPASRLPWSRSRGAVSRARVGAGSRGQGAGGVRPARGGGCGFKRTAPTPLLSAVSTHRGTCGMGPAQLPGVKARAGVLPWLVGRHLRSPSCPARSFPSPPFSLAGIQAGGSPDFAWWGGRWGCVPISLSAGTAR